jgi:anti-sigma B factor antagonist
VHDEDDHLTDVVGLGAPAFVLDLTGGAGGVTVSLSGDLDLWGGARLEEALDGLEFPPDHVTVDLSGVTFLDSLGVRALVLAFRSGRVGRFVNPSEVVARVLEASGLTELLISRSSA